MKRLSCLLLSALFVVACGNTPATTPSGTQPAGTPTGAAPTPTAQPTPTGAQPTPTGAQPGGVDTCRLITAEEMTAIWGVDMALQPVETPGECTFAATESFGIPSVVLRFESGDMSTPRMLFGDTGQDATIAGQPAVIGNLMGIIAYVQYGSQLFVVQSVLTEDTAEVRQQVTQTAETAYARLP